MRRTRSSFPLILDPPLARAVARRAKTQLRRLATMTTLAGGEAVQRTCGLHVANTYEISAGPGTEPLARIVVTGVTLTRLGDMGVDDARAEGHESMTAFVDWWLCRHDRTWPPREPRLCSNCHGHAEYTDHDGQLVPCTLCDYGEVQAPVALGVGPRDPVGLAARWLEHEHREVWAVSFMLDERLFLHRNVRRGYTSNPAEAAAGEPEVMDMPSREWVARADARRRTDQADVDSLRLSGLPSLDDQLAELRRMAAERGVDLTRERHVVEQRRETIERRLDEAA